MFTTYKVYGMTCEGCAKALTNAIKATAPNTIFEVDWKGSRISIEGYNDANSLAATVRDAGFKFGGAAI